MRQLKKSATQDGRSAAVRLRSSDEAAHERAKPLLVRLRQSGPRRTTATEQRQAGLPLGLAVPESNALARLAKRLIEVVLSCVVLLLALPLMAYIAVYIKVHSKGPVLFRQVRVKKNRRRSSSPAYYQDPFSKDFRIDRRVTPDRDIARGAGQGHPGTLRYYRCPKSGKIVQDRRGADLGGEPFVFYKFRTMYADARQRYPELYRYDYTREEVKRLRFKTENDPRVPPWAQWLRRSSLDELPNFINVLQGGMSLVGPRPDIPEMLQYYSPEQKLKLLVKPGVTGLAQIRGRGNLGFQDTLTYDLEYVRSRSFLLDLRILAKTVLVTVVRDGAH